MGIESESPVDRQFKDKVGYKIAYGLGRLGGKEKAKEIATEWGRRDLINRITGLRVDFGRWLEERRPKPKPRTMEYLTRDRVGRREFFRWLAGLGVTGGIIYGGHLVSQWILFNRLFNPEYMQDKYRVSGERLKGASSKEEIFKLYLLDGPEGAKILCKDIALASRGINKDTYKRVVFENFKSWGPSELRNQVQYFARLILHLRSAEGRSLIKKGIEKHGGSQKQLLSQRLAKLENWVEERGRTDSTLSLEEDLKIFFTDKLGYKDDEWRLLNDLVVSWDDKKFSVELKDRINRFNREKGVRFEIP